MLHSFAECFPQHLRLLATEVTTSAALDACAVQWREALRLVRPKCGTEMEQLGIQQANVATLWHSNLAISPV